MMSLQSLDNANQSAHKMFQQLKQKYNSRRNSLNDEKRNKIIRMQTQTETPKHSRYNQVVEKTEKSYQQLPLRRKITAEDYEQYIKQEACLEDSQKGLQESFEIKIQKQPIENKFNRNSELLDMINLVKESVKAEQKNVRNNKKKLNIDQKPSQATTFYGIHKKPKGKLVKRAQIDNYYQQVVSKRSQKHNENSKSPDYNTRLESSSSTMFIPVGQAKQSQSIKAIQNKQKTKSRHRYDNVRQKYKELSFQKKITGEQILSPIRDIMQNQRLKSVKNSSLVINFGKYENLKKQNFFSQKYKTFTHGFKGVLNAKFIKEQNHSEIFNKPKKISVWSRKSEHRTSSDIYMKGMKKAICLPMRGFQHSVNF